MFGKKKSELRVQHYEGTDLPINFPCSIEIVGENFEIKQKKNNSVISLPMQRIFSFSAMVEEDFMLKYHNEATKTAKFGNKYYLVVDYESKDGSRSHLAFWGTEKEYRTFLKWQAEYRKQENTIL